MPNLTITDQLLLTGADLNLTDDMIADSVIINCEEIHQASIVDDAFNKLLFKKYI